MFLLFIIAIVAIVVLSIKNNELNNEIIKYKNQENKNNIKYCPNCGFDLYNKKIPIPKKNIPINNNNIVKKAPVVAKPTYTDLEIRNTTILIVGAILIVIAAIVLLTSTWEVSHDLLKTLIVTSLLVVFLGASYIADKYLHIKQTAKIFLYIALAYLPLVFLSVSIFQLLGEYLSIYGEGKYIYLSISSLIISMIYYYVMRYKKDVFLAIGSFIMQLFSVILITLIFTNDVIIILMSIIILLILYNFLYSKNIYYFNEHTHSLINLVMGISSITILVLSYSFLDINVNYIYLLILYYFNLSLLLFINTGNRKLFKIIGPILILYIFFNIPFILGKDFIWYQITLLIGIIISYIIDYIIDKKINIFNYVICNGIYSFIYLISLFQKDCLPSYLIVLIISLLVTIGYLLIEDYGKDFKYVIPIPYLVFIFDMFASQSREFAILLAIYTGIFIAINTYKLKDKAISTSINITSIVFILFTLIAAIFNYDDSVISSIMLIILVFVFFLMSLYKNSFIYRLISYVLVNITTYYLIDTSLDVSEYTNYIIPLSTIIIFFMDKINKDNKSEIPIIILLSLSFLSLVSTQEILGLCLFIVLSIIFIYHIKKNNRDINFLYIPLILYNLFSINFTILEYTFNYMILINSLVTTLLIYFLITKKDTKYLYMSLLCVLFLVFGFEYTKYLKLLILIGSFTIYYKYTDKNKDVFKFFIYIFITLLLKLIIEDLNLKHIPTLYIGLFIISLLVISRDILKKHTESYKIVEYIGLFILNIRAIGMYQIELDGMLFVLLLIGLIIISYRKKMGPVFLTSLIFVLINMFLLTRKFWLSLPWWLYLLLVGIILIVFAITNELREKQNNSNKIKDIAKKIDL